MTDHAAVIAKYEGYMSEADKMRGPDYDAIDGEVAEDFGISREDVHDIMVNHWFKTGGG